MTTYQDENNNTFTAEVVVAREPTKASDINAFVGTLEYHRDNKAAFVPGKSNPYASASVPEITMRQMGGGMFESWRYCASTVETTLADLSTYDDICEEDIPDNGGHFRFITVIFTAVDAACVTPNAYPGGSADHKLADGQAYVVGADTETVASGTARFMGNKNDATNHCATATANDGDFAATFQLNAAGDVTVTTNGSWWLEALVIISPRYDPSS